MSTQIYVLAKCGKKQELIHGAFDGFQVSDEFERDPLTGGVKWQIIKVFPDEQQKEIQALELLMGAIQLRKLFQIK